MSTSDFDKHKVDHLFLLIGENPLPNYVAAQILLNQEGTLYLVHTTGTVIQAERLKRILDSELLSLKNIQLISLNDYESDAYHIQDKIRRTAESFNKTERLGMNYTGGTKAMAVHAYRALFKQRPDTVFSYLDPRRLEICIDREDGERIRKKVKEFHLEVKLATVFQLHGWVWKPEPTYEPQLPEAAQAFAEFHTDAGAVKAWRDWCDQVLRVAARKEKSDWLDEKKLKNIEPLSLEMLQSYESIKKALDGLGVSGEELLIQIFKEKGLEKIKHGCQWLDGLWLEHFVLQQVKDISKEWSIHESATSFEIKDPSNPNPNQAKFEFDVAFMRSYQLFAISCTTIDRKSDCKQKLFEAYVRAQQLGGTEARVALVCCAIQKDINALRTEIVNVFKAEPEAGLRNNKIAVFGQDDLSNLSAKLAEWIEQNESESR